MNMHRLALGESPNLRDKFFQRCNINLCKISSFLLLSYNHYGVDSSLNAPYAKFCPHSIPIKQSILNKTDNGSPHAERTDFV